MSLQIQTQDASLATLSVTIRALCVSNKQMTLAVFRQLPVASESDDAALWGIVRYAIKDEGNLWLVFSQCGVLMRREINPVVSWRISQAAVKAISAYENTAKRDHDSSPLTEKKSSTSRRTECLCGVVAP